jgi:SAM-dependent MidA family methyltransferase
MPPEANPIQALIAERGPVRFRDFMELALYHPRHGYYGAGRAALGRAGDYFTSVSVGAVFGRLLGVQFCEMWDLLGQPEAFTVVEQGANDGAFAADVLGWSRAEAPIFQRPPVRNRGKPGNIASAPAGAAWGIRGQGDLAEWA